ncbi:peroxidase [Phlebotomus argentipes]|uniref:peroxidase n=1 Tax=Phlebotomus argentipes TaxID=94469 RepID=UPI0028933877|nr:peroxidase [Phlebotomus argentipes]XP_059610116.1 peroxidase [Phlebotomus argentipes]XP_059610117.1 peroxidase [Phlebotomus argentipes]
MSGKTHCFPCLIGIFLLAHAHALLSIDESGGEQAARAFLAANKTVLATAVGQAEDHFQKLKRLEATLATRARVQNGSISDAQLLDGLPTDQAKEYDRVAQIVLKTSSNLLHTVCRPHNVADKDCAKHLAHLDVPPSEVKDQCLHMSYLNSAKGSGYHAYRRLLPADYKDGLYKIRTRTDGSPLPLPRVVSSAAYDNAMDHLNTIRSSHQESSEGALDAQRSVMLSQWSQFLEQDLVKTVPRSMGNGRPIECCSTTFSQAAPRYRHPACAPLAVPDSDAFYRRFFVKCLNYVRSALAVDPQCKLGAPNQLNQATNLLDLSQLYGMNDEETRTLRAFRGGKLQVSSDGANTIPIQQHSSLCLQPNETCYLSGDPRANANPYMVLQYSIFMRSHNNIAEKLRSINPSWNDERLFKFARKINTALYQKIIYEEWAPEVLGADAAQKISDTPVEVDRQRRDFGVSNEFATVAIRFYNSMTPGDLFNSAILVDSVRYNLFQLKDTFYRPANFTSTDFFAKVLVASLTQRAMAMDTGYVDDLGMQLFRATSAHVGTFGTDSLALDIARSRDHGLPGYIHYVKLCQGKNVNSWNELKDIISPQDLALFKNIYGSVANIDLIMGAFAEHPVAGATVGPTLSCILGEQLSNSRQTARSFYDNNFKLRHTVSDYTAAHLLCDTTDLQVIQENVFRVPSEENPLQRCESLKGRLHMNVWKPSS